MFFFGSPHSFDFVYVFFLSVYIVYTFGSHKKKLTKSRPTTIHLLFIFQSWKLFYFLKSLWGFISGYFLCSLGEGGGGKLRLIAFLRRKWKCESEACQWRMKGETVWKLLNKNVAITNYNAINTRTQFPFLAFFIGFVTLDIYLFTCFSFSTEMFPNFIFLLLKWTFQLWLMRNHND